MKKKIYCLKLTILVHLRQFIPLITEMRGIKKLIKEQMETLESNRRKTK